METGGIYDTVFRVGDLFASVKYVLDGREDVTVVVPSSLVSGLLDLYGVRSVRYTSIPILFQRNAIGREVVVVDFDYMGFLGASKLWWYHKLLRNSGWDGRFTVFTAPFRGLSDVAREFGGRVSGRFDDVSVSGVVFSFDRLGDALYSLVGFCRRSLLDNRYVVIHVARSQSFAEALRRKLLGLVRGARVELLSAGMSVERKREILDEFRVGEIDVLVTTMFLHFPSVEGEVTARVVLGMPRKRDLWRVSGGGVEEVKLYLTGLWREVLYSDRRRVMFTVSDFEPVRLAPYSGVVLRAVLKSFGSMPWDTIVTLYDGFRKYVEFVGRRWLIRERFPSEVVLVGEDGGVVGEAGVERVLIDLFPGAFVVFDGEVYEVVREKYIERLREGVILLRRAEKGVRSYGITLWRIDDYQEEERGEYTSIGRGKVGQFIVGRRVCREEGECFEEEFGEAFGVEGVRDVVLIGLQSREERVSFSVRHAFVHALYTVLLERFGFELGDLIVGTPYSGDVVVLSAESGLRDVWGKLESVLEDAKKYVELAKKNPYALHIPGCTLGNGELNPFLADLLLVSTVVPEDDLIV